eukprot:TRINITY_DN6106_c0_g1_i1.p1 TRINITY_DN6106_c0_g1~~TRINITY_DN6106_c0_g1_i1.p1  ORF type:complete len:433 (-),score=103.02 TRINITY_DN6106_c0_g1_i1:44-1342(-)
MIMSKPTMSLSQSIKIPAQKRVEDDEDDEGEISLSEGSSSSEGYTTSEDESEEDEDDETSSPSISPYVDSFSNPKLEDKILFRSVKYPPSFKAMFATTPSPPLHDDSLKNLSVSAPISALNKKISSLNKKLESKRQTLPTHNEKNKDNKDIPKDKDSKSTQLQPNSPATKPLNPISPLTKIANFSATRSSSTSSLFIDSSLSAPNTNRVLRCVATALYSHISSGHKETSPVFFPIFDESLHPIEPRSKKPSSNASNPNTPPRVSEIYRFIEKIFTTEKLPSEVSILSLVYIERLITKSGITLHQSNWRRVLLAALMLGSKVWEDQAVWNVDFLSVYPGADVSDFNALEKTLLEKIQYNVTLTGGVYAKYYFELRSLAEKDSKSFPLNPIDKETGRKLEEKSKEQEREIKRGRRSLSSDNLLAEKATGRHVIN